MTNASGSILMILLFAASLFASTAYAQTDADSILGKWTNEDKSRVLEFVKNGSDYEAIIKEASDKTLVGKKQITGLKYNKGSYKGNVYIIKRGKTLPCTLTIKTNRTMQLTASAGVMSQSQTWTKLE
jgi:uncharacterized protein (DUF2147 family)